MATLSGCFCWFPAAMLAHLRRAPTWRLHTKLYKFRWNSFPNNAGMKNRTDPNLGEVICLSIIHHIPHSWLNLLNGHDFYFRCKPPIAASWLWTGPEIRCRITLWFLTPFARGDHNLCQTLCFLFYFIYNRQGEDWSRVRRALASKMLRPKDIRENLDNFNGVTRDTIEHFLAVRGEDGVIPNLENELAKYAFECKFGSKKNFVTLFLLLYLA